MWKYIEPILYPLFVIAAIGFISLLTHIFAWFGSPVGLINFRSLFFGGVFIVFIPAVFVQFKLLAGEKIYYHENPFNFFRIGEKGM